MINDTHDDVILETKIYSNIYRNFIYSYVIYTLPSIVITKINDLLRLTIFFKNCWSFPWLVNNDPPLQEIFPNHVIL